MTSPMPSGSVLPSSRDEQVAELLRAAMISAPDLVEHVRAHFGRGVGPARGTPPARPRPRASTSAAPPSGKRATTSSVFGRVEAFARGVAGDAFAADEMGECVESCAVLHVRSASSPRAARLRISARDAERPRRGASRDVVTVLTSVPSSASRSRTTSPILWVKPRPGVVAVLRRREQRAEEQHEAVRILMLADRLADQIHGIAADLRTSSFAPSRRKPSGPSISSSTTRRAHVVEREAVVEQADERADRAGGVVVLGLAEQQRAAAFEVAQVDVVAERRADGLRRGCSTDQHDFGLGIVPGRIRAHADLGAPADRWTAAAPW